MSTDGRYRTASRRSHRPGRTGVARRAMALGGGLTIGDPGSELTVGLTRRHVIRTPPSPGRFEVSAGVGAARRATAPGGENAARRAVARCDSMRSGVSIPAQMENVPADHPARSRSSRDRDRAGSRRSRAARGGGAPRGRPGRCTGPGAPGYGTRQPDEDDHVRRDRGGGGLALGDRRDRPGDRRPGGARWGPVRRLRRPVRRRDPDAGDRRAGGRVAGGARRRRVLGRGRGPAGQLRRPAVAALPRAPAVGRGRRAGLPQARGPEPHRRAQDQQLHRPGGARAQDGQAAADRRDRRRPARRGDRDGGGAVRPAVRGLHGRRGRGAPGAQRRADAAARRHRSTPSTAARARSRTR